MGSIVIQILFTHNNRYFPRSENNRLHFYELAHLSKYFNYSRIIISEIFEKIKIQKHFWVFENDSLGINYVDSYDGGLPF